MTNEEKIEQKEFFERRLRSFHHFSKDKVYRLEELHDWMDDRILIKVSISRFNYIEYLQAWCALIDQFIFTAIEEVKIGNANSEEVKYNSLSLVKDQRILEKELLDFGAVRKDSKIDIIPNLESLLSKKEYTKEMYIENAEKLEKSILSYIKNNIINDGKRVNQNPINPFPYIFSSGEAYRLFSKLHKVYANKKSIHTANYSFIYYALNNDDYLVCNQTSYIDFLNDNFEILIDRIDIRQLNSEKKLHLYNSFKNNA